jgi:GNAT superfamily N-acetyltransferase
VDSSASIRPALLEDARILAELGERTFRETFEGLYPPPELAAFLAEAYGEAIQSSELADPARPALLLELQDRPLGFAQLRLGHREPGVPGEHPVELQRIYLLRSAQGGGRGVALLNACEARARAWGADTLWLGVWEHNAKALAFYARNGFREVGEHVFQIGQQRDRDLLLAKELV